jgi:molybdopterin-synthase adenylyltransferase
MSDLTQSYNEFAAALPEGLHVEALRHVLRQDGQEDLTFGLWYPSRGQRRLTALIHRFVFPQEGDRRVHGNVAFNPQYFERALQIAMDCGAGLFLLHSHLGPGWQGLSKDDINAEAGRAGAVQTATGLPFVGLTAGTDGSLSARFWKRVRPHTYEPAWCASVRVAGQRLQMTFHPRLRPVPVTAEEQERTVGVWGSKGHADINRLRIAIVGVGSVGSLASEALARQGVEEMIHIDFDRLEKRNRDRVIGAYSRDVGRLKVDIAADHAQRSSTAGQLRVDRVAFSVVEADGFRAALDADVIVCCVDRPWPRRVLNHIAYAHVIPVINGGILVRHRGERIIGADWHVHTVGPHRHCLECWEAFDPGDVALEMEGKLDDPTYLKQLDPNHPIHRHENVFAFSMNVASWQILHLAALLIGPIHNFGDQCFHFVGGNYDQSVDHGCKPKCLYAPIVATGDSTRQVTGFDHAAAKSRIKP